MGAYTGAARRRVHLSSVLLRPPSGHRPGRRQARHARMFQIGLHLTLTRSWRSWRSWRSRTMQVTCLMGCEPEVSGRVSLAWSAINSLEEGVGHCRH